MINKFKSLGELTYEEKKVYWKSSLSGSVVKRVITEPLTLLKERWGFLKPVEPGFDPTSSKHSNEWVQAIMKRGTYFEDSIIRMGVDDKLIPETKIDKRTFQSTINDRFTANIDGLIGEDINNVKNIVEVKYTTTKDKTDLIQRYIYQMMFYMWFFNVKEGCYFLFYQETIEPVWFNKEGNKFCVDKGFPRLISEHVKRDDFEEKEMLKKIDAWLEALSTFNTSLITWGDGK